MGDDGAEMTRDFGVGFGSWTWRLVDFFFEVQDVKSVLWTRLGHGQEMECGRLLIQGIKSVRAS